MEAKIPSITLVKNYGTISQIICNFIKKAMRTTKPLKSSLSPIYEHSGSKPLESESNAKVQVFFCPIFPNIS